MKVCIIGGGIAGSISVIALSSIADKIYLIEKENSLFQYASSKNGAILRTYERDPYISLLAKESALLLYSLQLQKKVSMHLCGLWIDPLDYDPLEFSKDNIYFTKLFNSKIKRSSKREKYLSFIQGLVSRKQNNTYYPINNANKNGLLITSNGVIHLKALLNYFQKYLLDLQKAKKLEIHLETELQNIQVVKNTIQSIDLLHKGKPMEIKLKSSDYVVNASGAWAKKIRLQKTQNSSNNLWSPPLESYKRHLYTIQANQVNSNTPVIWNEVNDFYIKPQESSFLVSGCDETLENSCNFSVQSEEKNHFKKMLSAHIPTLEKQKIIEERACLRTFCIDERPVLGFDPYIKNFFWVTGLGGRGVSISLGLIPYIQKYFKTQKYNSKEYHFSCERFV